MLSYTAVSLSAPNDPATDNGERRAQQRQALLADQQAPQNLPALSNVPCVDNMAGIYPCNEVDLLAFMPLATIGGGSGNDIWGWTDPLDGSEYAIMGRTNGTSFVDITDPYNPVYLGNLPPHTSNSTWRDIKVHKNHAFIVSEASGHGMQVFDLTQLRDVTNPPVTFSNTTHYNNFGSAHNIVINEESNMAYAVGANCGGGLHMIDIKTPATPTYLGCFSSDGYTHDAQCVIYNGPDQEHQGQEICFNANEDTLTIVDVTVKNAPVQLSRTGYAGRRYTHQGWLTEDHAYFLLNDELDEMQNGHNSRTYIWDVQDLDLPVLRGSHLSSAAAIDHNLYVSGNYVYQANYRAGLRILELTDLAGASLTEVGYFDIYPSNNNASFNGAWSNYPYFESGTIIVSGIEQGLFVLRSTNVNQPVVEIALHKTVGLGMMGAECPTAVDITLPPGGGEVHYCYEVTNSGEVTLTNHSLVDTQLGTLLLDEAYSLAPGEQFVVTATAVVTESIVGSATWSANNGTEIMVEASSAVTVHVPSIIDDLTLVKTVGATAEEGPECPVTDAIHLPVGGGLVTHCYQLLNQSNVTLTMHSVVDDALGVVWQDETVELAPAASFWLTTTAVMTESAVSQALWTASYQGNVLTATAVSTVTVTPAIYAFELTTGNQAMSGTIGTAVDYTLHLTNSGNITDSYAISLTNDWDATGDWLDPVSLAAEQSITLTVTITVLEGVENEAQDELTVMVHSLGNDELMAVRLFTTTALIPVQSTIYFPLITR